jgi:hypothetical protein|uniref:Uncharacterized protein n=1 Tax=Siphoviridae sp. ctMBu2 TaxID=2827853 RepID=A0A8S5T4F2_9CAUD|nr:MAG TPA: hypothetical protein [Siphoviridae sp. ctMBu2]
MEQIQGLDDLIYHITGANEEEFPDVTEVLADSFGISYRDFTKITKALLVLTPKMESSITGEKYYAFMKDGFAIAKMNIE